MQLPLVPTPWPFRAASSSGAVCFSRSYPRLLPPLLMLLAVGALARRVPCAYPNNIKWLKENGAFHPSPIPSPPSTGFYWLEGPTLSATHPPSRGR